MRNIYLFIYLFIYIYLYTHTNTHTHTYTCVDCHCIIFSWAKGAVQLFKTQNTLSKIEDFQPQTVRFYLLSTLGQNNTLKNTNE